MDPNKALKNMIEAAINGEFEEMVEHAEGLSWWMSGGGVKPQVECVVMHFDDEHAQPIWPADHQSKRWAR